MSTLSDFWKDHGTKALGTATTVVSGLLTLNQAMPGIIPDQYQPYLMALGLVLGAGTVKRGFTNSANAVTAAPTQTS